MLSGRSPPDVAHIYIYVLKSLSKRSPLDVGMFLLLVVPFSRRSPLDVGLLFFTGQWSFAR